MRVVLTPVPVGYGTSARCVAIAAECRRRSHEVLFACHPSLHERIRGQGFECAPIRDADVDPGRKRPAVEQYLAREARQRSCGSNTRT